MSKNKDKVFEINLKNCQKIADVLVKSLVEYEDSRNLLVENMELLEWKDSKTTKTEDKDGFYMDYKSIIYELKFIQSMYVLNNEYPNALFIMGLYTSKYHDKRSIAHKYWIKAFQQDNSLLSLTFLGLSHIESKKPGSFELGMDCLKYSAENGCMTGGFYLGWIYMEKKKFHMLKTYFTEYFKRYRGMVITSAFKDHLIWQASMWCRDVCQKLLLLDQDKLAQKFVEIEEEIVGLRHDKRKRKTRTSENEGSDKKR